MKLSDKKMILSITLTQNRLFIPFLYTILQIGILFCMRQFFKLTVFQTVAAYAAVCIFGVFLAFMGNIQQKKHWISWKSLRDIYLLLWSGFHGVIVLGFMTCGTYYLTLTQVKFVQLVNIFLGMVVYWFFYVLSGKVTTAIGWGNLLIGFIGTVNYYLVRFRGAPFQLADFKAMKTAGNVVNNYDFTPDLLLIVSLANLICWYIVWKIGLKEEGRRWNFYTITFTVVMCLGCIMLPVIEFQQIHDRTNLFAQDAYLADFVAEIMGSSQSLPENYSLEEVEQIAADFLSGTKNAEEGAGLSNVTQSEGTQSEVLQSEVSEEEAENLPHIVVIMNEAFSDLRVLGNLETDVPVLEYWDSLEENCIKGWANVSVLGGTTANSEYEFLTSDAVALYDNTTIPYNKYFSGGDEYPGLVSWMKQLGYETTAFHPYLSSGWNRQQVYRAFGFDKMIFSEDLTEALDTIRLYTSDQADYDYIIEHFEENESDKPQFFFNITMQNHGGYTYDGADFETTVHLKGDAAGQFPQAEQYLSLMKASDGALEGLLSYFSEYEEPVIVVLFGDHQPRLEDGFYEYVTGETQENWDLEQRMQQYKTPFIIWHNYETEEQQIGDVSLSYLAAVMLESAGLPMSDYQRYVYQQYFEMPVVNRVGIMDAAGNVFAKGSTEFQEKTYNYRQLIYNHTVDKENRLTDLFE